MNKKLDIHNHILPRDWPDLKQVMGEAETLENMRISKTEFSKNL